ncbi:MAG: T9SS type A sorting domain-containing protein [candidate division Zixibacteria bacterium]
MKNNFSYLLVIFISIATFALVTAGETATIENAQQFRNHQHKTFLKNELLGKIETPQIFTEGKSVSSLALNFDDLLVSETSGPANFAQENADLAALSGGRIAAAWEDNRSGPVSIYLQIFDANGNPIGSNELLVFGNGYDITDPHICPDADGNFYVIWREDANGFLQAARFDSTGAIITDLFFVSDTLFVSYAGEFDAACLLDGKLVVVWENYSIGNDIAYRIFNTSGVPTTSVMLANSDGPFNQHWSPAVARGENNNFAITWEDYRGDKADIYFRRFDPLGNPYAAEYELSDADARDSARFLPSIIFNASNGYVVAWVDLRDGRNIYGQTLSSTGTIQGTNVLISDETSSASNWEIDLSTGSSNSILAAWTVYAQRNTIILQRFSASLEKNGTNIEVSDATEKLRFSPAVAGGETGNAVIVWTDLSSSSIDIFADVINSSDLSLGSDFVVNDDSTGAPSIEPAVADFGSYEWEIVFTDLRRDAGDIMLQRAYVGGSLNGVNRRINSDTTGGYQSQPAIASDNDKLCISWTDVRSNGINGQNIVCCFVRPHYNLTDEIVVNDDNIGSASHFGSDCAINLLGITLITWTDTRMGNNKVFGQLFGSDFSPLGANFLIGPDNPAKIGELSKIAVDENGNFIVVYLNRLFSGGPAIELKKVTTAGVVWDLFTFQSDQNGYQIDEFDLVINDAGDIIVVWHGYSFSGTELFLTVFDNIGNVTTATFPIIDDPAAMPGQASTSIDSDGYLFITWLDSRTGSKSPFKQIFESGLTPLQGNVPVSATEAPFMQNPVAANNRGRGVAIWADARENGMNIYAAQDLYAPTSAENDVIIPTEYSLAQNHPNPFNPFTTIDFSLPQAGDVKLEIFNLLGQRVRLLSDSHFPAGTHKIIWDGLTDAGRQSASGIYLYRLTSEEFQQTRKMMLLK